jgi:hypothetical protein
MSFQILDLSEFTSGDVSSSSPPWQWYTRSQSKKRPTECHPPLDIGYGTLLTGNKHDIATLNLLRPSPNIYTTSGASPSPNVAGITNEGGLGSDRRREGADDSQGSGRDERGPCYSLRWLPTYSYLIVKYLSHNRGEICQNSK